MAMDTNPPPPKLSMVEKLAFAGTILSMPIHILMVALKHLIIRSSDSPGVRQAVAQYLLHTITSIPIQQQIAFFPETPTRKSIIKFCTKHSPPLKLNSIPLAHSATLHLISPPLPTTTPANTNTNTNTNPSTPKPPKILLFFHGGGYLHAAGPSHLPFAYESAQDYSPTATLAALEYTLSPVSPYPTQLKQAIAALNYVLTLTTPSQVIIAGDSAGAHLAVSLLSHMLHPGEGLEPVSFGASDGEGAGEGKDRRLAGMCLVSPLLSFDLEKASYTTNAATDYLSYGAMKDMVDVFKPKQLSVKEAIQEPGLSPGDAPAEHWTRLPFYTRHILLTIGEREVFHDSCVEFASTLKTATASSSAAGRETETEIDINLTIGEGEWHDAPVVDRIFGLRGREGKEERGTTGAVVRWMRERGVEGGGC